MKYCMDSSEPGEHYSDDPLWDGSGSEEVRHASRNADSAYLFCHRVRYKKSTLSQHFVTHVVPPLVLAGGKA